ncbi:MAG TPA: winged helix-turn-helix domain-containing protein [Candidatus Dojkabacteria bacterium]|nr:winged helix-turn-helix domain-containing protein [Candidatus Dojkabacteria bacterium]
MTYSIATRYANMFEVMADPYALMILDFLFETHEEKTVEELVKETKTTESKVRYICEKLVDLNVLDKDYRDGKEYYEALDTQYGNFLEYVIERID